jgi:hypothetical protein
VSLPAIALDELDLSLLQAISHGGGRLVEVLTGILTHWELRDNVLLDDSLAVLRYTEADGRASYVPAIVEVSLTGHDISSFAEVLPLLTVQEVKDSRPDLLHAMETYRCDECRDVLSLARTWDLVALHFAHGTAGLCFGCATKKAAAAKKAAAEAVKQAAA